MNLLTAKISRVFSLFLLIIGASCSYLMEPDAPTSAKDVAYNIQFDSQDWVKTNQEHSDYAWTSKTDGCILLSNSICDDFQEQPLDKLANKTFNTISELKLLKKEFLSFHDREAYRVEGTGKVDGVAVELKLLNTRRNHCYFDFVSITPMSAKSHHQSDFDDFLKAVIFK